MLLDSLIIFYYDVIFSVPLHILTSSGEAAEERNRGAAQRVERWRGGASGAMERGSERSDGEGERLRARQRRQAQFNRAQRRHIILHHQRHIIIQIHLDLITQIRTFDEISEIF